MSGFAVMVDTNGEGLPGAEFNDFLELAASYKLLGKPASVLSNAHCCGAKLDSPSSLHKGVTFDEETGSWLIAVGTVVDTQDVSVDGNLCRLLKDYLTHGASVFWRCDGLFALAIYNGLTQSVSIVSDPFGYFSVFYGSRNGRMFVATSALAVAQQVQSKPNEMGVHCFLRTGKVFGEMTLWQDVKRMPGATVLEISHDRLRESTYWTLAVDESVTRLSFAEAIDASMEFLQSIVKRNLEREGKVWTDLTGGFDTRFMVMILDRLGLPFKANFVGDPRHPDVKIAKTIVDKMGWDHQHFELPKTWTKDSPHYLQGALGRGDAHLNIFLLLRALWAHKQECGQHPTLLSGLGGEMWRGPIWWPESSNLGQSTTVHYDRQLWSLMHPIAEEIFVTDTKDEVKEEIKRQFKSIGDRYPDALNTVKLDCIWTYRETAHVGAWASVAAGLVRILPILFSKDIVTYVISLDNRWKRKNRLVRHIFEKYSPTLANIEVEGRGPAVPRRLTNAHRFIPSRLAFYRKSIDKLGQITLGRSLWPTHSYRGYSQAVWRQEALKFVEAEGLFQPANLRSENLYKSDQLQSFLAQAQTENFRYDEFLGRVITVEMALDAIDSDI